MSEDIVIDEVVQLEPEGDSVRFERTEYSTVVFHNIAETYPEDAHIECSYTVTSSLVPTTRDWVGLYKVGWMSPKDYVYYEWAPIPKDYLVGADADGSVLFPAHKMPKDDGEFYQFCYVASSSQIRGASTPFQFKRPGSEDFVEVEDDETDMLVIRSKTVFLEENLQKAEVKRIRLEESLEALQKERDEIVSRYQDLKKKLGQTEGDNEQLTKKLAEEKMIKERLKMEARDMNLLHDELQERISKLKEELQQQKTVIQELEDQIVLVKREMMTMKKERDELSGQNSQLQGEVQMYKDHFSTSQMSADEFSRQKEELQLKLAQNESMVVHQRGVIDSLKAELEDNKQNLDKQMAINFQDKDYGEELGEKLKNAEDKLAAAEESKMCLIKEITTFEETQEQLSRQIEHSKSECEGLKHKLCALEEDFSKKNAILHQEMDQTSKDLSQAVEEKATLQEHVHQLQTALSETKEKSGISFGSMSIMQQSLSQIKLRLEKKEKQCQKLERTLKTREEEHIQRERELAREADDLKEKIQMCSVEYKAVYIEKNRLEKKLEKLSKKKSRQQKMSESYVEVEREMTQTAESSDKDEVSSMADLLEMERQIEGFGAEMERGLEKKLKYKTLYKQELDRREELEKQHKLEMAEKLTEIETLKAALKEIPCSKDLKIRALEKCVSDSEKVIDDLNEKLRQSNRGRNDEASLSSSLPRTPGPGSPIYPGYAVLNSPHPQQNPWLLYPQAQSPPHLLFPQTLSTVPYSAQTYPQSPPIQYPAHYPVQRSESTSVTDEAEQTTASLIDKVESDGLEKPLTPLPAPLAPQVMHMAKDAIDESSRPSSLGQQGLQDLSSETGLKVALPDNNIPSAPPADNDRFYDAEGPSMRYCQECNQVFSADVTDQAFEEHQLSHIGAICPFCKKMKSDEMTDQDFEHHVSKHMDDKEQLLN